MPSSMSGKKKTEGKEINSHGSSHIGANNSDPRLTVDSELKIRVERTALLVFECTGNVSNKMRVALTMIRKS